MDRASSLLTVGDAIRLGVIINAAIGNKRVAFAESSAADPAIGIARSIGSADGHYARQDQDVRDCWLRVTLDSGTDVFWRVSELVTAHETGDFCADLR